MTAETHKSDKTVADALAQRVEARQGGTSTWSEAIRQLGAVDRAAYEAVAITPTPILDIPVRKLTNSANYSRLWFGIAATIAILGGKRGRRVALEGMVSVGVTSATVNLAGKNLSARSRPTRVDPSLFPDRQVRMPESPSFPSGHAASGFAFAYAVGRHMPALAVPLRLLAGAVAYSRVHTGVHYPGDVAVGSAVGAGIAAMVAGATDRLEARQEGWRVTA